MLAHNVYFALKQPSDVSRDALIAACQKYLTNHPGIQFFAVGKLCDALNRPVNVRDFDVSLHIVFDSQANHDAYQDAPRHHDFVNENQPNWAHVRVFDSTVS